MTNFKTIINSIPALGQSIGGPRINEKSMGSSGQLDLNTMTDDYEILVRPHDARWEAVLTRYSDNKEFRGVGSSPTEAIEQAFQKHR